MTNTTPTVSRRAVAKGAAWAVPAVVVAAASPAYAGSQCVPSLSFSGDSCRCPGEGQNDKEYFVTVCNNGTTCPDDDGFIYVTIRANTGQNDYYAGPIQVPVGACSAVVTFSADDSSINLRLYYASTADDSLLLTAPYLTVNAPNDCEEGDLGTCLETTPAPRVSAEDAAKTPAETSSEAVQTPAETSSEAVQTPAETSSEAVQTPAVETPSE